MVKNPWSARQIATAGASSDGVVERIVKNKREKFDLRESGDLSEGEEEPVERYRSLPRDVGVLHSSNILNRVVTRQPVPSVKTDTATSENLLPPTQIQGVPANVSRNNASYPNRDSEWVDTSPS